MTGRMRVIKRFLMNHTQKFTERWHSDEVGAGARIMALLFAIVNVPTMIAGMVFFFMIPVSLPGMVLYVNYWLSVQDRHSWKKTRNIWRWTVVYNIALVLGGVLMADELSSGWMWFLMFPLLAAGLAGVALRSLHDHKVTQEAEKEAVALADIEAGNEICPDQVAPQSSEKLNLEEWEKQ